MRRTIALSAVAALTAGLGVFAAAPAMACTAPTGGGCADTTLTVNLTGGTLSISAPATASMTGSVAAGTVIGPVNLGSSATQVTDNRGSLLGWTVTAITSGDLTSVAHPTHKISLGTAIAGGPLTLLTGTISPGAGSLLSGVNIGAGGSLNPSAAVTVAAAGLASGGGTYSYTPTLTLTVPANTYAESDYTTTITQSVQ